jgi:hypothetical protein
MCLPPEDLANVTTEDFDEMLAELEAHFAKRAKGQ